MNTISSVTKMFPVSIREIGELEQVRAVRAAFQTKVDAGEATKMDVLELIMTLDTSDRDFSSICMGVSWMYTNVDAFAKIIGDVDAFMDWILELAQFNPITAREMPGALSNESLHLRNWFLDSFLLSVDLMKLLSPKWREQYVQKTYPHVGTINHLWISAAMLTGVSRKIIATAILNRLDNVHVVDNYNNEIGTFLRYGTGPVNSAPVYVALQSLGVEKTEITQIVCDMLLKRDPRTGIEEIENRIAAGVVPSKSEFGTSHFPDFDPWWVLTNEEFVIALTICADKCPNETFGVIEHPNIVLRLNEEVRNDIVKIAIGNTTSLKGVDIAKLERVVDLFGRKTLARHLVPVRDHLLAKPTAQFLFGIITELHNDRREEFWVNVIVPVLKGVHSSVLYPVWRKLGRTDNRVEETLRGWLKQDGYILGTVVLERHPVHGMQQMVVDGNRRYICDNTQHRYHPVEGDLVLINTRLGRVLTSCLKAVFFVPVLKEIS